MLFRDVIFKNFVIGGLDIKGRASRSEFFYYLLFALISVAIFTALLLGVELLLGHHSITGTILFFIYSLTLLNLGLGSIVLMIRRLHDLNKSGLYLLIPLVIFIIAFNLDLKIALLNLILLGFLVIKGIDTENKYGNNLNINNN